MKQSDCYQLGRVVKTHGLKGEVSILLDVDFPKEYENMESVFLLQKGRLVPFFIDIIQISSNKGLVKFEEVDSIESASKLVKSEIYLPLSLLPDLPKGGYYFHDLVGCEVFESQSKIGSVKEVMDLNGNELLSVMDKGREMLIPMKEEILKKVDIKKGIIEVDLPNGLLDLYTES